MSSTPLTCCSIGAATVWATTTALAPGKLQSTWTVGGEMCGNWARGTKNSAGATNLAPHSYFMAISSHPPVVMFVSSHTSRHHADGRKELFNVREDEREQFNMIKRQADVARRLSAKLIGWRIETGAIMPQRNPAADPKWPGLQLTGDQKPTPLAK